MTCVVTRVTARVTTRVTLSQKPALLAPQPLASVRAIGFVVALAVARGASAALRVASQIILAARLAGGDSSVGAPVDGFG
jgi:hypothetical protein